MHPHYFAHDNGLFLFEPETHRVYQLMGRSRIEVTAPAALSRLRLKGLEIPEGQARRLIDAAVAGCWPVVDPKDPDERPGAAHH